MIICMSKLIYHHTLLFLASTFTIGFLISGCGESELKVNGTPTPSQLLLTYTPSPSPTLTQPEIDATKMAAVEERRRAVDAIATQFAQGTPYVTTPLPFNPAQVDPPPVLGIHDQCVDADPIFSYRSCWTGQHANEYIFVGAGAPKDDPTQGMLRVYTTTLDRERLEPDHSYATPRKEGLIRIVGAANFRLTLQTDNGARFTFDVLSRQWVNP